MKDANAPWSVHRGKLYANGEPVAVDGLVVKIGLLSVLPDADARTFSGPVDEKIVSRILSMERALLLALLERDLEQASGEAA